jgi:HAD superfamily phosphoserine phosphatase-like hydrolase
MNVYDFDNTIYNGDSGIDFIKYSLKKKPLLIIFHLFVFCFFILRHIIKEKEREKLKEKLFSFVNKINNFDSFIDGFVTSHKHKIKKWYFNQQNKKDVIITSSLDFYVNPLCELIGIENIISTKYDIKKGNIIGKNCFGKEKVKRFKNEFPGVKIKNVYSDSNDDLPLLKIGEKAFVVKKNNIFLYDIDYKFKNSKLKMLIDRNFLLFIFCGGMGTLTNFIFSMFFSINIHPVLAYVYGYGISIFVSYYLNIKLIFKRRLSIKDFAKFVLSYIPNFLILFSFVYLFINFFSWSKVIVYLLAAIFGIPITYIIVKLFAFSSKRIKKY